MPPSSLTGVRAIVYDLDGTLYEDTHHFEYYAGLLEQALPPERRAAFRADFAAAAAGRHALRIGTIYDVRRDRILTILGDRVQVVQDWSGAPLESSVWERDYRDPVVVDHQQYYNVGDMWWVPAAVAAHHGLPGESGRRAFLATRDWMAGPDFQMVPVPGLREAMAGLRARGVVQALATNSPQPDSDALLTKLGLYDLLDHRHYSANKPAGFRPIVAELCERYGLVPPQVLVVGDNYVNEVAPAVALGCRTAYIDAHGTGQGLPCDLRTRSVRELVPCLERIGRD